MSLKAPKNYYMILGIGHEASLKEIKSVYRKLARELHPDVNPDLKIQERFKDIVEAYAILSDAAKRRLYDLGRSGSHNLSACTVFNAARMRDFLRRGGLPTTGMLLDALKDNCGMKEVNCDAETAKLLLGAGVIPDEACLEYAVQTLKSSYWAATLIRYGATPTPQMLQYAVDHRLDLVAKELLKGGVAATREAVHLTAKVKQPGGWLFS